MNILWFTNTPCSAAEKLQAENHRGGWLKSLEQELIKREGIDLHISFYYPKPESPFKYNKTTYYPLLRKSGQSKVDRYLNTLWKPANRDKKELQQILSIINQVNPDIIHIHGTEDNFGLIQQFTTKPIVFSIQGLLTPYSEKYYSGIPSSYARTKEGFLTKARLKSAGLLYRKMKRKAAREIAILSSASYVIGRTSWDNRASRIMAPHSTYFTNNEILRNSFYTSRWHRNNDSSTIRIITVSSNNLYKGLETIVKTAQLLSKHPNFKFEWNVVGLHQKQSVAVTVKNWLKADFHNLSINLLGSKNENEVIQHFNSAHIYCQVSHIENSPNSLCEAMLMGMPIVASYAGGTGSLMTDGEEGILVQDGDPYAFAGAILELSANPEEASRFGENAQRRAQQRHNREKICEDLATIYSEIINKTINAR